MEYENYDECDGKRGSPGIGVDLAVLILQLAPEVCGNFIQCVNSEANV